MNKQTAESKHAQAMARYWKETERVDQIYESLTSDASLSPIKMMALADALTMTFALGTELYQAAFDDPAMSNEQVLRVFNMVVSVHWKMNSLRILLARDYNDNELVKSQCNVWLQSYPEAYTWTVTQIMNIQRRSNG